LIIGANDVGKTNLVNALRLLLDPSLSELDLTPNELDFYVTPTTGDQAETFEITIKFAEITKDAIYAIFKGAINDDSETFIQFKSTRSKLDFRIFAGPSETQLDHIPYRFYLKHLNLRYIESQRDLKRYIRSEKLHLINISKEAREQEQIEADERILNKVGKALENINKKVRNLCFVKEATAAVNVELKALAHHNESFNVRLDTGAIQVSQFIEKLELGAITSGTRVVLGGDGRNNQILMALWKAKSEREHDLNTEEIIFCVEEPEAHLHPHQQRKMASYLAKDLPGQAIITSHSPQIAVEFKPDSIVRLFEKNGSTIAASDGCSNCIETAWLAMGYRMSILPAEAFFASAVLLVEGPSEILFYNELARQLKIDLDFFNITILSVDGIDFAVYIRILNALKIPWVMRTDNDISKVPKQTTEKWAFAGISRAYKIINENAPQNHLGTIPPDELAQKWSEASTKLNPHGIYLSNIDLENDLCSVFAKEMKEMFGLTTIAEAVQHFQQRKAINMTKFLVINKAKLKKLKNHEITKPLDHCLKLISK